MAIPYLDGHPELWTLQTWIDELIAIREFLYLDTVHIEYTDKLSQITQPTLICSGTQGICTPVVAASLYENIPRSRWHLFRHSRHTCFVDAP